MLSLLLPLTPVAGFPDDLTALVIAIPPSGTGCESDCLCWGRAEARRAVLATMRLHLVLLLAQGHNTAARVAPWQSGFPAWLHILLGLLD